MKKEKNTTGITLIALVVTMIVLIILAVVSINMVFDDNGIIKQAEETKSGQATQQQQIERKMDSLAEGFANTTVEPVLLDNLVDKVEIGDYVDIGIEYANTQTFYSTNVTGKYPENGMTGWRVLSKTGKGESGAVTLVSAGTPLSFCHVANGASTSITMLENLNTEIEIVGSGKQGFTANSFADGNNLKNIFKSCAYIDSGKSIHALGCSTNNTEGTGTISKAYSSLDEIEATYETLTGTKKSMNDLSSMSAPLKTASMKSVNPSWSSKANDLLGNGMNYWLGGASYDASNLWRIYYAGRVVYNSGYSLGIRPVLTLKAGVKIAGDNTGDGSSENAGYKLSL